jgi:hypothetical protein
MAGWRRSLEDLERVQNRRGPNLEKRVAQPLLGHIECYLGIEYAHVEREQAIHVLGQEGDVMNAFDESHRAIL